jgi:hypothetical protein
VQMRKCVLWVVDARRSLEKNPVVVIQPHDPMHKNAIPDAVGQAFWSRWLSKNNQGNDCAGEQPLPLDEVSCC